MSAAQYDDKDLEQFYRDLGDLKAKFLSLEYFLRTFLFRQSTQQLMQDLDSIKAGDMVDANPFTDGDTLATLVDKYNALVRKKNPSLVIYRDKTPKRDDVVGLRDALAHGRIYWRTRQSQPRLLKFSKNADKKTGKFTAEMVVTLDAATLRKWNTYLFKALNQVYEAL